MQSRTKMYTRVRELSERDLSSLQFKDFQFRDNILSFEVTEQFLYRPDILTNHLYGKIENWWLLMMLNGIEDVWNDMVPGLIIAVPSPNDMDRLKTHLLKNAIDA